MGLLITALGLSVPAGLVLGIAATRWDRLRPSRWLTLLSTAGLAMPSFYIGSLLILGSVAYALWRGGGGGLLFPLAGFGWDRHMVFPLIALMLRPTVQIAQITASLLVAELGKQYVAAARSMGHSWHAVKQRLALRNILAPVVLTIAGSLRMLVTDLILVEWLFSWPGLGRFLAYALIPARRTDMASSPYLLDPPFLAALLVTVTAIFLLADFIASVLVRVFDPRLRIPVAEEVTGV
jgi:peptide/nickel transport system permease protein